VQVFLDYTSSGIVASTTTSCTTNTLPDANTLVLGGFTFTPATATTNHEIELAGPYYAGMEVLELKICDDVITIDSSNFVCDNNDFTLTYTTVSLPTSCEGATYKTTDGTDNMGIWTIYHMPVYFRFQAPKKFEGQIINKYATVPTDPIFETYVQEAQYDSVFKLRTSEYTHVTSDGVSLQVEVLPDYMEVYISKKAVTQTTDITKVDLLIEVTIIWPYESVSDIFGDVSFQDPTGSTYGAWTKGAYSKDTNWARQVYSLSTQESCSTTVGITSSVDFPFYSYETSLVTTQPKGVSVSVSWDDYCADTITVDATASFTNLLASPPNVYYLLPYDVDGKVTVNVGTTGVVVSTVKLVSYTLKFGSTAYEISAVDTSFVYTSKTPTVGGTGSDPEYDFDLAFTLGKVDHDIYMDIKSSPTGDLRAEFEISYDGFRRSDNYRRIVSAQTVVVCDLDSFKEMENADAINGNINLVFTFWLLAVLLVLF
jgi:hypothetical protein